VGLQDATQHQVHLTGDDQDVHVEFLPFIPEKGLHKVVFEFHAPNVCTNI